MKTLRFDSPIFAFKGIIVDPSVQLKVKTGWFILMGHRVGPYIGLNEIRSPSPMKTFITINYLFNFIFGFIR